MGNCALSHTCGLFWKLCGLMCQSVGWCVNSINPPIEKLAQFSFRSTLIDSPSAVVVCLLGICAPLGWISFFCINKAQITSSKLVRTRIEVLLLLYCVIVYYSRIKKLWRQDLWCNALHVWMVIVKCLWGIICVIYHCFCWLIVGLEGESSLLSG